MTIKMKRHGTADSQTDRVGTSKLISDSIPEDVLKPARVCCVSMACRRLVLNPTATRGCRSYRRQLGGGSTLNGDPGPHFREGCGKTVATYS